VEFRILGPLQVLNGDVPIEVAGTKRKALLALLVLRANEVVRSEWLIDELWGANAPRNAPAALHNHVSRLRKALGPEILARREWGYVLRAAPETVDLRRFEQLVAHAEALPARERSAKLAEALGLWRGPPLEDVSLEPALEREVARLEELRLTTLERRIDADLETGGSAQLTGELEELIAANPLREHLRWQLILALYRSGRQAEALEVYRETRRMLADELGLDPSPALRELERAILRQDPSLVVPVPPPPSEAPPAVPPPRRRSRVYVGLVALALLGAGGAVTASALSRGGHKFVATRTQSMRTIIETIERPAAIVKTSITKPRRRATGVHAKRAAVTTRTATRSTRVAQHVTRRRTTVVRKTRISRVKRVTHGVDRAKHTTTTTTTTVSARPVRIADDFSEPAIDPLTWSTWLNGTGGTTDQTDGRLVMSIPADAQEESQWNSVGVVYGTRCTFAGDFDARIDYTLLDWPASNGAAVALSVLGHTGQAANVARSTTRWGDVYNSWPDQASAPIADTSGSLRIARSHGVVTSFFLHDGRWRRLGSDALSGELSILLGLGSNGDLWQHVDVSAALDNFVVTAPDADCPAGSDPRG